MRGSLPSGPGPSLNDVRLAGSAFCSLGLSAVIVHAVTCRSSMCVASLKRSFSSARTIIRRSSMSTCGCAAVPDMAEDARATSENLSSSANFGRPAISSSSLMSHATVISIFNVTPCASMRPPGCSRMFAPASGGLAFNSATSNSATGLGGISAAMFGRLAVGWMFTLSTTRTGCGIFCGSSFSPSCWSTATRKSMPSAPARASSGRGVHLSSKSHAPLSPVASMTGPLMYPWPAFFRNGASASIVMFLHSTMMVGTPPSETWFLPWQPKPLPSVSRSLGLPLPTVRP